MTPEERRIKDEMDSSLNVILDTLECDVDVYSLILYLIFFTIFLSL